MFLGIDVGTTGVKALLLDRKGNQRGIGYQAYPTFSDGVRSEQSCLDWYRSTVAAVREALTGNNPSEVEALSFSSQAGTLTLLDENGNEIRPSLTWMDARSVAEAKELAALYGDDFYEIFGSLPGNSLDAAKLLWLKRNEPENFARTACYAGVMEYMMLRLTGRCVTDVTNGAMRQIIDTRNAVYDKRMLDYLGISEEKLPVILPPAAFVGTLKAEAAADLGLPTSVKVFNGMHDQYCSALGNGLCAPGDLLVATGTTWVMFCVGDKLMRTPSHLVSSAYPIDGLYGAFASLQNGGSALKWLTGLTNLSYDTVNGELAKRGLRSDVFFMPYMGNGAGFPTPDPTKHGQFRNLTLGTDAVELALAVMEGVAFEARRAVEVIRASGVPCHRILMCGGAAKSPIWRKVFACVMGQELTFPLISDSSCVGAAILAMHGCTGEAVADLCRDICRSEAMVCDNDWVAYYQEKYARYVKLLTK